MTEDEKAIKSVRQRRKGEREKWIEKSTERKEEIKMERMRDRGREAK